MRHQRAPGRAGPITGSRRGPNAGRSVANDRDRDAGHAPVARACACTCALHGAASVSGRKCSLAIHPDGKAALVGSVNDAQGRRVEIVGDLTVVPMPVDRVEPMPFTAFQGDLTLTGGDLTGRKTVDVVFVDNLMYEIALPDSGGRSLALTCNPP